MIKRGTVRIQFASSIPTESAMALERWIRSWFALVGAGAFPQTHLGLPSFGELLDIVAPFPGEYVAHFEFLMVDAYAYEFLLDRIGELHIKHGIRAVEVR